MSQIDFAREELVQALALPNGLSELGQGYTVARSTVGESGCGVYRFFGKPDAADFYLKYGRDEAADDLSEEFVRLRWLARWVPVPEIRRFVVDANEAWLLTGAVAGETAFQALARDPGRADQTVDAIARFLATLHDIPVLRCPFTSDHRARLYLAHERVQSGLVDADDFDDERQGWSADQVWQALQPLADFTPDTVVTHGDFSLDNLFVRDGEVLGCIDVGRLGLADRYQDLAVMWNCLGEFGPASQSRFLQSYGIDKIDRQRLQFHLLLDELF